MRKFVSSLIAGALLAGWLSVSSANATDLYDLNNYSGQRYYTSHSSYFGAFNDKTSSIRADRYQTYFEDINWRGRSFYSSESYSALSALSTGLDSGSWNNRISSIRHGR